MKNAFEDLLVQGILQEQAYKLVNQFAYLIVCDGL